MVILPHRRKAFRTVPASGGGGDPYFENVVLLLHADGTNGSTTFVDSSNSAKTITTGGNAQITTTSPKFGTGAALFDGNADYLELADSDDWHFGSSDFTIEMWLSTATVAGISEILGQRTGITFCPFAIQRSGSLIQVYLSFNNATWAALPTLYSGTLVVGAWHHVAITRNASSFTLWFDGTQISTYTSAASFINSPQVLRFGGQTSYWYNGKMDDLRITKGVARYTSNFTPPTQAFPDVGDPTIDPYFNNVVLLLHCDGSDGSTTFVDSSNSAHTVTAAGTAQVDTAFQKFGTGSVLLEASTANYLSVAGHADFALNADFTIEFWYRPAATPSNQAMIDVGGGNSGISIRANQGAVDRLWIAFKGFTYNLAYTWTVDAWHYVAVVRAGSTIKGYVNGTQVGSDITNSGTFTSSTPAVRIGHILEGGATAQLRNIDEVRITKGVARDVTTVPTAAFPNS